MSNTWDLTTWSYIYDNHLTNTNPFIGKGSRGKSLKNEVKLQLYPGGEFPGAAVFVPLSHTYPNLDKIDDSNLFSSNFPCSDMEVLRSCVVEDLYEKGR